MTTCIFFRQGEISMQQKEPSLLVSLIPVALLVILLTLNVVIFKDDSSYGPNQIALLLTSMFCALIGVFHLKRPYKEFERKALDSVSVSTQAILILMVVGSLIGIWILNGVVPTMIYYGIKLISPEAFLPLSLIICSIVSVATGSSWSTAGTVGIALIGIGKTLGIPEGMVAGAIVSGAYFGDKMSPLSDTTNLAPAMAGSDLFSHIRHMIYTTGPTMIITFIIFLVLGLSYSGDTLNDSQIQDVLIIISKNFNISLWLFLLPLVVIALVMKKVPAVPALVIGTLLGAVFALFFQSELMMRLSGGDWSFTSIYKTLLKTSFSGFEIESGNKMIDKLFSRGGMSGMMNTVWMILMAMIFGGMMEVTGMLNTIATSILKLVRGTTSLVAATIGSGIFLNLTTSDQYIAIVVTGRMFKSAYQKFGLKPKNLSRAVEDGSTVTSVLVPWNTCGAYFSTVLGVATMTYLPFAFFNLISPFMSIAVAASGKTMDKIDDKNVE
jgi:NhaC family Na+:H+ antiporter